MRDFDNHFFFVVVIVVVVAVIVVSIFFFFFSINASDIVVEYNKNENEKNKSEIDMIYCNHQSFAFLILLMRATFEKWLIDNMRVFVELASSKMRLMFNEQTRIRVQFNFFKIADAITSLCHHFFIKKFFNAHYANDIINNLI